MPSLQALIQHRTMEQLIVTIQAPQKTNIWLHVTELAKEMGCHIRQAQGQKLADEDAAVLLMTGNWNTIAKLEAGLTRLCQEKELLLHMKRSKSPEVQIQRLPYFVEVLGLDELGMLFHICRFFTNENISIENLQVESYISSATSAPMFSLKVSLGVPSMINIGELRERFILFCEDLNIDGAIEPDKR